MVIVESSSFPISAPVAYMRRASDAPKSAMKKFSVMKNTAEMARSRKKPTSPTTPAPAAFLLTASLLLLSTSKNPDGGSGTGALIGLCLLLWASATATSCA